MCCGICLDKIRLNPDSKDKRFGILRKSEMFNSEIPREFYL